MFTHVLIGIDGRQGGLDAAALASRLAAGGAELTLAYVYAGEAHAWRGSNAAFDAAEHERAVKLLEQARDQAGTHAAVRAIGAPSPGRGLHVLAEEADADLLVVGSSRRGLLGRVLLGDDTRAALHGASCAVAIAPAGYAEQPGVLREIGVGYNESVESEHALTVARKLAETHAARLSAFQAVSLPAYQLSAPAAPAGAAIEELVDQARARIEALGVEPHAAYGRPSEELALYSASLDLLVVGSRDYGPISRVVHGSTSQQLARTARCPLLVLTAVS